MGSIDYLTGKPPSEFDWANRRNHRHWFNASGNYVDIFDSIDGKTYMALIEPKDWTEELWALYRREGIRLSGPTPVEQIRFPEDILREEAEARAAAEAGGRVIPFPGRDPGGEQTRQHEN